MSVQNVHSIIKIIKIKINHYKTTYENSNLFIIIIVEGFWGFGVLGFWAQMVPVKEST